MGEKQTKGTKQLEGSGDLVGMHQASQHTLSQITTLSAATEHSQSVKCSLRKCEAQSSKSSIHLKVKCYSVHACSPTAGEGKTGEPQELMVAGSR